jgi:hypothetical protein
MAGPNIPSRAQTKTETQLEEERVKFENEKRLFIERVASYELIASQRLGQEAGSFEYAPATEIMPGSVQAPAQFQSSFDPTKFEALNYRTDLSWFTAPNLGINYTQPEWVRPPFRGGSIISNNRPGQ